MSNFDAVITDLKWLVGLGQRARTSDVAQLHQAIRVLEAAGKVDKEKALAVVQEVTCDMDYGVYGLISALPDEPKGE
jgi:hypothetical protein